MTLEELKAYPKPYITPTIAGKITGQNPYSITICAREHPERLGYPVSVSNTRTRIPKLPFINFWYGEGAL